MKLTLLFTSLIALSVAVPAPEAAPEADAAEVAGNYGNYGNQGNYGHSDKCGNRQGTTYGYIKVQYGDAYGRVTEHDVPVYCGQGRGTPVRSQNIKWARMTGGRSQGRPVCQVRYYPQRSRNTRTSHISSRGTHLDGGRPVTMHSVYCNI